MKKLLLGSFSLFLFSLAVLTFQISCKEEVTATDLQENKSAENVFILKKNQIGDKEFWMMNSDGSNLQKLDINLPDNVDPMFLRLTPDKQYLLIITSNAGANIYRYEINSSELTKIVDESAWESGVVTDIANL